MKMEEKRTCPSVHQPSIIRWTDRLLSSNTLSLSLSFRATTRGIALIYVDTIFIRTDR